MKDEPTWKDIWKKGFYRIGAYVIVYFILIIYTASASFELMVTLALAYIVVDVTLILIKLEKGK